VTRASHTLRANIAAAHRKKNRDPEHIAELRDELRETLLVEWVERQLAAAPPLSPATRDRLVALLAGGDRHVPAAR
jgi:hypothetical protein